MIMNSNIKLMAIVAGIYIVGCMINYLINKYK